MIKSALISSFTALVTLARPALQVAIVLRSFDHSNDVVACNDSHNKPCMVPVLKVNYFNKLFRFYLGKVNSLTVPALESTCFSSSRIENVHTNNELECEILAPSPDFFYLY